MRNVNFKLNKIRLIRDTLINDTESDAVVTLLTEDLSWGSALTEELQTQTGRKLYDELRNAINGKPKAGSVHVMPADELPFEHMIVAVMPEWDGGVDNEQRYFRKCHREAIRRARELGCRTITFPGLSQKKGRYIPYKRMLRLSLTEIIQEIEKPIELVHILCNTDEIHKAYNDQLLAMRC